MQRQDRKYKPLLPAVVTSAQTSPQSSGSGKPITPDITIPPKRSKRHGSGRSACDSCRARKTACDSQRPRCGACRRRDTECAYTMPPNPSSEDDILAMESLKRENDSLRSSADILEQLRSIPEQDAIDLLRRVRASTEPASVLGFVETEQDSTPEQQPSRYLLPPAQSSLEFELMMRHPISYPTLVPAELSYRSLENVRNSAGVPDFTPSRGSKRTAEALDSEALDGPFEDDLADGKGLSQSGPPVPDDVPNTPANTTLCDPTLQQLHIQKWSQVAITDEYAAKIISFYLQTDHPVLGLFDADLFLQDLISGQQHFCSALLVNALLGWACQSYSHMDPNLSALSLAFFEAAKTLWESEKKVELLTTVAASQLLSLAASCYGRDEQSVMYLKEGIQMGKRMGLFGVPAAGSAQQWLDDHGDWVRAASHTAWGVLCWVTFRSLHFQTGQIESPPFLPVPGDSRTRDDNGKARKPHPLPPYMGTTFPRMCAFWTIVHDIVWTYYDGEDRVAPATRARLDFAESTYQRLLKWADDLPTELARGNENAHHVVIAHIYYHAAILDLFRPFLLDPDARHIRLATFTAADSTPEAVYLASVNQLKQLVLVYMTNFASTFHTFLWHTALLYIANAMLLNAQNPESREWFRVCISGYENMLGSFRVAGTIAQGLLSMAIRNGAMTGAEAHNIVQRFKARAARGRDEADSRGSLIVDLHLAVTNPDDAQVGILAARFNELVLFEEFTTTGEER